MPWRNVVCSGRLDCQYDFNDFIPLADRAYLHKPRMLKFRRNGITLLIFNNLKFRTMGGQGLDHEIIYQLHKNTLHQILTSFPWACQSLNMEITTMTFSFQVPYFINFHYLSEQHFYVDTEMFPAAKLLHTGSCHVNVFATGHVVATGVKSYSHAMTLIDQFNASLTPECLLDTEI